MLCREAARLGPWAARWPLGVHGDGVGGDGGPLVVLVHGLAHNRSAWTGRAGRLNGTVVAVNLPTLQVPFPQLVGIVGEAVRRHTVDGPRPVHLVGHSLGGLVVRDLALHRQVGPAVWSVATLGSPHAGTPVASWASRLWPRPLPGAAAVRALRAGGPVPPAVPVHAHGIRWLSVAGGRDGLVPPAAARLQLRDEDGRPVAVTHHDLLDASHMDLLVDRRVGRLLRALHAAPRLP